PTAGYQNVASQAPQSLPAISQPPQSSTMGYMGSQSVSMGYQPYNMQNLMATLPSQDASLPPQQPYIAGQQPVYQQWETHTLGPFSADRTRTQVLGQTHVSASVDRKNREF
ncbi:HGS isoform 15, partial [Pongo abelii]